MRFCLTAAEEVLRAAFRTDSACRPRGPVPRQAPLFSPPSQRMRKARFARFRYAIGARFGRDSRGRFRNGDSTWPRRRLASRDHSRYFRGERMKASRFAAFGVVAAAALWIASGHCLPRDSAEKPAALRANHTEQKKPFRVAVTRVNVVEHARRLTLSGRTEADKRVVITARGAGVLTDLRVKRGMWVQKDDVIAVLSDEAREAQLAQAQAGVTQKRTELEAKRQLIMNGTLPRLQLVDLEAQLKAAEASLAAAEAERDRGVVRAPWSGVVQDLAVEVGQAAFSFTGKELATLVALDPMLVVVEVAPPNLPPFTLRPKAHSRLV